jgi:hypothetical protein
MKRRSPTLEGLQAMFRVPSLGLAEIAWRWSFGLAAAVLLVFSVREYLATLPVTAAEMFLLRSRQPALILQAIAHVLRGSAARALGAAIILMLALTLAWVVLASLGRAATLKTLIEYFREGEERSLLDERQTWDSNSLMGLNFFRAMVTLSAALGFLGALVLAAAAAPEGNPSPGSVVLIFYTLAMFVGLAWLALNWFLSLAGVFVVSDGRDTFGALGAAADLCWVRIGSVAAATIWFGLAHVIVFVAASSMVAFPLAFVEMLPAGVVLGGVLLVALFYFATVDFLHVGQLAAYVFMTRFPGTAEPPTTEQPATSAPPLGMPPNDDILSDIPGLVPPPELAGG